MSKLLMALAAFAAAALGAAGAASAADPVDKPVISSASAVLAQSDLGAYPIATVGGYNFTPGGKVLTRFYDATADPGFTRPFAEAVVTAGNTRPISGEGGNYGQIRFQRILGRGTSHCNHWLYVSALDYAKSPRPAYQWSHRAFFFRCP